MQLIHPRFDHSIAVIFQQAFGPTRTRMGNTKKSPEGDSSRGPQRHPRSLRVSAARVERLCRAFAKPPNSSVEPASIHFLQRNSPHARSFIRPDDPGEHGPVETGHVAEPVFTTWVRRRTLKSRRRRRSTLVHRRAPDGGKVPIF